MHCICVCVSGCICVCLERREGKRKDRARGVFYVCSLIFVYVCVCVCVSGGMMYTSLFFFLHILGNGGFGNGDLSVGLEGLVLYKGFSYSKKDEIEVTVLFGME